MSAFEWRQQQLDGMAALLQRLGLDLRGNVPCRHAPISAIDLCRTCASRAACKDWHTLQDVAPHGMPSFCPKAHELDDAIIQLTMLAPTATRH